MKGDAIRITRLAILGSISISPLLILPTMVGALVDYAGFTESQAGWVAAVGSAGNALAAIVIGLRIRHLDPRKLAVAGMVVLGIFDALSMLVAEVPVWLFLTFRALSGLGGATAYAAVMASYATMPNSERGYGVFVVLQFALSAVGLYVLPLALPTIEATGMYLGLAAAAAFGLTQTAPVISRAPETEDASIEIHMLIRPAAILVMLGIGLFETANNMHFTYVERIGLNFALSDERIGEILGATTLLGIPAAFAVVWIGDRYGEFRPIMVALVLAILGLLLLLNGSSTTVYTVAMGALSVAWAFGLPYFQAYEARLDPGGSVVVTGGFFTSIGTALGPALAATLVLPNDYSRVLLVAAGVYAVIACLMVVANRYTARES
jgi:MFS family permease